MSLVISDENEICDYKRLKRYFLIRSLLTTGIHDRIRRQIVFKMKREYFGIDCVAETFCEYLFFDEFKRMFRASLDKFYLSEIQGAEFLLSQCIILCDEGEPTHFNFLIVASFLNQSIFHFLREYECFRILYIADFCFDVLYDRLFRKVFESKEIYEKLKLFCLDFLRNFSSESTLCLLQKSPFGNYWMHFVEGRHKDPANSFSLNEKELELFEKFYSLESNAKDEECPVLSTTENARSSLNIRSFYPSDCKNCGSTCSNYLSYINLLSF
ncbi:hypothetical protein TNCT_691161 [Trichonephila clavata]|uniref:Uncharacterized protein n=1 Tax=Trichonephila clavata TaxID=2740835 RepID=A0A8X6H932_TRICU|nr:hypothetical protein TNCT_691161 [Trichonephila clavata]